MLIVASFDGLHQILVGNYEHRGHYFDGMVNGVISYNRCNLRNIMLLNPLSELSVGISLIFK